MSQPINKAASRIIDALGGTAATARLFSISMPSVTNWRWNGIPRARMMFLEAAHPDALASVDIESATSELTRGTSEQVSA